MAEWYKKISVKLFSKIVNRSVKSFETLKPHLRAANIGILLETWVCMMFFTTLIVYFISLFAVFMLNWFLGFDFLTFLYLVIFAPVMAAAFAFLLFYVYPVQKANRIRNSIESNLPFALSHMGAVASSGVPPEFMFSLLTRFKEYGEVTNQAKLIVKNIKNFGMSSVAAIKNAAERTPSPQFKQILTGIASTIEKGGDLGKYLNEMAERSLFEYRVKRENYLKTLSTYADIYTAVLISAPLMMMIFLAMMGTIGGDIMGFTVEEAIFFLTWIFIPVTNTAFLVFLQTTSPTV